jgi:hypothetical protein
VRGVTKVGFQKSAPRGVALVHGSAKTDPPPPTAIKNGIHAPAPSARGGDVGGSEQPRPGAATSHAASLLRPSARMGPMVVLGLLALAAVGALVAGGPALTVVGVLVLTSVAAIWGWRLGEDRRKALRYEVDERNEDLRRALSELEIAQAETVRRLSMAVEFRDEDTGAHIERIGRFSTLLSEQVGMSVEFCRRISHAAPLHDVGKVAIPDAILLKPGSLTPEERSIVETHAEEGHRLLRGSSSSILDMGATIALSHHERWDGGGYPRGLAGEEIPIEGRIVAIADVFDALTSHRVYRGAFSVEKATEMMIEQSGSHFDPILLEAFLEVLGSSGADARTKARSDKGSLLAQTLEVYTHAIQDGDAESAEGAVASAIEDGIDPVSLRDEVVAPAMRVVEELCAKGDIDADIEQLASGITRRVLATLNRYMLARGE